MNSKTMRRREAIGVIGGRRSIKVTQIAFPEAINNAVHTTGAYASRGSVTFQIGVSL